MIAKEGYAVLTIDQRGVGETGGYYLSFQDDYSVFSLESSVSVAVAVSSLL